MVTIIATNMHSNMFDYKLVRPQSDMVEWIEN